MYVHIVMGSFVVIYSDVNVWWFILDFLNRLIRIDWMTNSFNHLSRNDIWNDKSMTYEKDDHTKNGDIWTHGSVGIWKW